ncbi:hypothetical protein JCM14076_26170 [Methylosoma difficile]
MQPENNDKNGTDLVQTPPIKQPDPTPNIEELGGVTGLEPTRYGDWEKNGRCVDF